MHTTILFQPIDVHCLLPVWQRNEVTGHNMETHLTHPLAYTAQPLPLNKQRGLCYVPMEILGINDGVQHDGNTVRLGS